MWEMHDLVNWQGKANMKEEYNHDYQQN